MIRTLGGDRLGSGKKMQVELHGYQRSTFNISKMWRSTMSAGTLVPFICEPLLPGSTLDIDLDVDVKTHPTIGPLFGSYKIQLDVFSVPMRLYNSLMHNNTLNIGYDMEKVKIPQIRLTALPVTGNDLDNTQVNPSALPSYFGIRGVGVPGNTPRTRDFNAIPILAYHEIYKNYYANKQEGIGAVIHRLATELSPETVSFVTVDPTVGSNFDIPEAGGLPNTTAFGEGAGVTIYYTGEAPDPDQIMFRMNDMPGDPITFRQLVGGGITPGVGTLSGAYDYTTYGTETYAISWEYLGGATPVGSAPLVKTFPLDNIDTMRKAILAYSDEETPFLINTPNLYPYRYLYEQPGGDPNILWSQEGLLIKTYQSDKFNNWLETESIEAINTRSAISTVGDSFTIDQFLLSKKVYDILNRIAVSGGSFGDWINAAYAEEMMRMPESPVYMGGLSRELVFQEVVSNSFAEGAEGEQPLGTLAGRGVMGQRKKGGYVVVKAKEPQYVIGLVSLTPRLDYSQGNRWDIHLKSMDDWHKPGLDGLGFQDLITEEMCWWDTKWDGTKWVQKSAGKQPAWLDYMTNVNEVRGNFANDQESFMVLLRRYEGNNEDGITDLTTYVDPVKFNFIFADTALDAQNFWVQIACNMTARRKMSAKIMPNL